MRMTPNRRIGINIVATYLRSFYKLALGLVTARWLLMSLGQTDYGLLGVVGGLVAFVTIINSILASAVGRFYAVAIGRGNDNPTGNALSECRRWFTSAVIIHTIVPVLLMSIGWPLGEWAVDHFLVIPPERLTACHWVWRMSCCSALVGMLNVPFRAMYTAKQEIAEMTVYSMLTATLNAVLLYYMVSHPGDWLASYAAWHCLLVVLPMLAIGIRAVIVYPECRIDRRFLWNGPDLRRIAAFAGWTAFDMAGSVVKSRGLQILVNRSFGAEQNAAMTVASRLAAKANVFAAGLVGAFSPAIVTAYGAGKLKRATSLVLQVEKIGGLLVAVFSLPLCLEVQQVMRLWLKNPPEESPYLCVCVLITFLLDKMTLGHRSAVAASGRVAVSRLLNGTNKLLCIPVAWVLFSCGFDLRSVGWVMVASTSLIAFVRLEESHRVASADIGCWLTRVAGPIAILLAFGAGAGFLVRSVAPEGALRIALVVGACELVMLPMAWFGVLDAQDRGYVKEKCIKVLHKLQGRKPGPNSEEEGRDANGGN